MAEQVKARVIVEVVGYPKEHVEENLNLMLTNITNDKSFQINKKEVMQAKPVKELFSAFSEMDITFKDINQLMGFCVDYLPSSVEIYDPERMEFKAFNLSGLLNDMLQRFHQYEMVTRTIHAQNLILNQKLQEIGAKNPFKEKQDNKKATKKK